MYVKYVPDMKENTRSICSRDAGAILPCFCCLSPTISKTKEGVIPYPSPGVMICVGYTRSSM